MAIENDVQQVIDQLTGVLASMVPDLGDVSPQVAALLAPSVRLALMGVLDEAARDLNGQLQGIAEISTELQSGEPVLVGRPLLHPQASRENLTGVEPFEAGSEEALARFTLRMPESLKAQAEQAAARSGLSLNMWIVQSLASALNPPYTRTSSSLHGWMG